MHANEHSRWKQVWLGGPAAGTKQPGQRRGGEGRGGEKREGEGRGGEGRGGKVLYTAMAQH
jgi:hypothetical protein